MKYQYPLENGFNKCQKKEEKKHWVVYSDQDGNQAYQDPYAQYPNIKISFLEACYVIDEKNGFLELVKYSQDLLPPRKGIFASIFNKEKRFKFEDLKKVEYVGWIHKSKLLLNNKSWVANENLKPLRYIYKVGHPNLLSNKNDYLKEDTVKVFSIPELLKERILEEKIPMLEDIVYVYKKSEDGKKRLVGYTPSFTPETVGNIQGWISEDMILSIGQQQVLLPRKPVNNNSEPIKENVAYHDQESVIDDWIEGEINDSSFVSEIEWKNSKKIESPFLYNTNLHEKENSAYHQNTIKTFLPIETILPDKNGIINIDGGMIHFDDFINFKKSSKELNIILVIEKKAGLSEKIAQLSNSIQRVQGILAKEEFQGYHPHFYALCYNQSNVLSEGELITDDFIRWRNFIQKIAGKNTNITTENVGGGLESVLGRANELLKNKADESNILIVTGTTSPSFNEETIDKLSTSLGQNSVRLLFWQLENEEEEKYMDFNLSVKSVLYGVGESYSKKKKKFLIEHRFLKTENYLKPIEGSDNIYMFDYPENSMYQGIIASPKMKGNLHPELFDQMLELLLIQMIEDNSSIIGSLQVLFDELGSQGKKKQNNLRESLYEREEMNDSLVNFPLEEVENYWLDYYALEDSASMTMEHFLLLSNQEHENYVNLIKRLAPIPPQEMSRKYRRKLYKSYKKYFKDLKKIHCLKVKTRKTKMDELIFLSLGISANNIKYSEMPLKYLKRKRKFSHADMKAFLIELRGKGTDIEQVPINQEYEKYIIKDMEYNLIPLNLFP